MPWTLVRRIRKMSLHEHVSADLQKLVDLERHDPRHVEVLEDGGREDQIELPAGVEVARQPVGIAYYIHVFAAIEVESHVGGSGEFRAQVRTRYVPRTDFENLHPVFVELLGEIAYPLRMSDGLRRANFLLAEHKGYGGHHPEATGQFSEDLFQ